MANLFYKERQETINVTTMEITELRNRSKIDRKDGVNNPEQELTRYQKAINDASFQLEKVHSDGYNYSKKGSRSKVLTTNEEGRREKRKYVQEEVRKESPRFQKISQVLKKLSSSCNFRK